MTRPCLFAAAVAAILAGGCGSGDETDSYKLVPVTGKVTQNGQPVAGAQVSFSPDPSNKPITAGDGGVTDATGTYKATFRGREGLAPGKYTIAVSLPSSKAAASGNDPFMSSLATQNSKGGAPPPAAEPKTFDREVTSSGGPIDLELKGGGAAPAPKAAAKKK